MDENIQSDRLISGSNGSLSFIKIFIVILFCILPIIGFVGGMHYQNQNTVQPTSPHLNLPITETPSSLLPNPRVTDPQAPDERWKTYTNEKYGFAFDYLLPFIEEGNDAIVKLSTSNQFEKDEFALVIEVRTAVFDKGNSIDSNEHIVEKDLQLSNIAKATGKEIFGSFLGDSPWSYYNVYFHKSGPEFVEFKIRIHTKMDTDLTYKHNPGNTYEKLVTDMLSTFKFLSVDNVDIANDQLCI